MITAEMTEGMSSLEVLSVLMASGRSTRERKRMAAFWMEWGRKAAPGADGLATARMASRANQTRGMSANNPMAHG